MMCCALLQGDLRRDFHLWVKRSAGCHTWKANPRPRRKPTYLLYCYTYLPLRATLAAQGSYSTRRHKVIRKVTHCLRIFIRSKPSVLPQPFCSRERSEGLSRYPFILTSQEDAGPTMRTYGAGVLPGVSGALVRNTFALSDSILV